jgi:hypothetical protein
MASAAAAAVFIAALSSGAMAQGMPSGGYSSQPMTGATGGLTPPPPRISASQDVGLLRHRNALGKACLQIWGYARPHTMNPNLYDHMISADNSCAQLITVQVCYYRSTQCVRIDVPGRGHKETLLGMLPAIKDFRYEFKERF